MGRLRASMRASQAVEPDRELARGTLLTASGSRCMTRNSAAFVAASLCLSVFAPVADGHMGVAPETCGIKRAKTELLSRNENGGMRIVARFNHEDRVLTYYACRLPYQGRPHERKHGFAERRLLRTIGCLGVCHTRLAVNTDAGHQRAALAYVEQNTYGGCCTLGVTVVALSSGRRADIYWADQLGGLTDFDVSSAGTAVWLDTRSSPTGAVRSVRGLTLAGEELLFDSAPSPEIEDVALANETLYWLHGGEPQTAHVP